MSKLYRYIIVETRYVFTYTFYSRIKINYIYYIIDILHIIMIQPYVLNYEFSHISNSGTLLCL